MLKKKRGILSTLLTTAVAILSFYWVLEYRKDTSESDSAWSEDFSFITSTLETDLMAEGGWWDEMATKKPSTLPTMPEFDLLEATQTALALTPSTTPTRTPLFDVNASASPRPTQTQTPIKEE